MEEEKGRGQGEEGEKLLTIDSKLNMRGNSFPIDIDVGIEGF